MKVTDIYIGFNRTFLVLKFSSCAGTPSLRSRFNRTFLVLKFIVDLPRPVAANVLIAPFWY